MKTTTIKQTATFKASPKEIYDMIMDEKKVSAFTGSKVTMSAKVNGKFNVFDGYCHGYNIDLVEGRKIVQAWHFEDEGWPEDHYSICTFLLEPAAKKTKLIFTQTGVPEQSEQSLKDGWKQYYWWPMKEYLEGLRL